MNGSNMRKVQTSSTDKLCKHESCKVLFERVNQFHLSLKSFEDTKKRNTFEFKYYCIIKFVYVYQVTPNLTWMFDV